MTVQSSAQSLLVEVVSNKTNATSENEETVQDTHAEVVLSLFGGESTRVAEQVDEANSNTSVNVENKIVLLRGCNGLNSNGVVEELVGGEVLGNVLLDQLDTEIGVVAGLDPVADTGNCGWLTSAHQVTLSHDLLSLFSFLIESTKSRGLRPLS